MIDFNKLIQEKTGETADYSFLNTHPHLGTNIHYLTYGGSKAYGTNVEGSDTDD